MVIRNAAKALILSGNKVLLVKYRNGAGETCYTLPGGGQHALETMEEAIKRECLEETGYDVAVGGFLALYEEIVEDRVFQEKHPDYTHKIFHIFLCHLSSEVPHIPTEEDESQTGCEWVELDRAEEINLYPMALRGHMAALAQGEGGLFLGTRKLPYPQ